MTRDALEGLAAAAAAVLTMTGTAVAGLLLLDAGRAGELGPLTAAAVALALGAAADVNAAGAGGLPVAVEGTVEVMPLGVSLAGAVVLGVLLLRRGSRGLPVRSVVAVVAVPASAAVTARLARGTVTLHLPRRQEALEAGFSVATGPAVVAAGTWVLTVVAVCWLAVRFPGVAAALRGLLWALGGLTAGCLLAAGVFGGAGAAGAVVLALPLAVCGALLLGFGVPWTVRSDGVLSRVLDTTAPVPPRPVLMMVAGTALLACACVAALRAGRPGGRWRRAAGLAVRLAPAVAAVLVAVSLLGRMSVRLGADAYGFSLPLLNADLAAAPLLAGGAGLVAGAVAGFAASLLADAALLSWPACNDRVAR